MNNSDFLYHMTRVKQTQRLPLQYNRSLTPCISTWDTLLNLCRQFYRYIFAHIHDFIYSTLFGYLTLNERLYVAVHENDIVSVKKLLECGAVPSYQPHDIDDIVNHLSKTRLNKRYSNSTTSTNASIYSSIVECDSMLYMAVSNNNLCLIKQLTNYYDFRKRKHTEAVSLCLAIKRGYFSRYNHDNIVEHLIDYAHINPNDCVQTGCKHCKCGKNLEQKYQFPLYHACKDNHFDLVKYLLEEKHCHINQLTTTYETALHGALLGEFENKYDTSRNSEQRYLIVNYLLNRKDCDPNIGVNPLCVSLFSETYDYTTLLLDFKCDVNRLGYDCSSKLTQDGRDLLYPLDHPLCICLRLLISLKEKRHSSTHHETRLVPGHYSKEHAIRLIKSNSNIYACYDKGSYPLLLCVKTNEVDLVELMLEQNWSYLQFDIIQPLIEACIQSRCNIVKLFIRNGYNPNTIVKTLANKQFDIKRSLPNSSSSSSSSPSSSILSNLNRYCSILLPLLPAYDVDKYSNSTPFLSLCRSSSLLFHEDLYESTMKTVENLFSQNSVHFSSYLAAQSFFYSLQNEHYPFVYLCIEHGCLLELFSNKLNFKTTKMTRFCYTLFSIIDLCFRCSLSDTVKQSLLKAYSKTQLKIISYDVLSTKSSVCAYIQLWFNNKYDLFMNDPILIEHIRQLPYTTDIIRDKNLSSKIINHMDTTISTVSNLKHLCRLKIRSKLPKQRSNLFSIIKKNFIDQGQLPITLCSYLFYDKYESHTLIDHLLHGKKWNDIDWI